MARTDSDMTQGAIWRHLLQFSLPMAVGLLFQQLYNTDPRVPEQAGTGPSGCGGRSEGRKREGSVRDSEVRKSDAGSGKARKYRQYRPFLG